MARVTRNVSVADVADLLDGSHRACLARTGPGGPDVVPVELVFRDDRYLVGVAGGAVEHRDGAEEVVVLVDDGIQWFDLRAIYVRGLLQPAEPPSAAPGGWTWFEVTPHRIVAWDYGSLREVDGEA